MPANLAWTNMTGNGLFDVAANWRNLSTGLPSAVPPAPNDHLTFDGTITHANLVNLHGFNLPESVPDFASISFINGYSGTVTIAPDGSGGLSAATYVMNTGAIAQPIPGTDLSVLGAFNWTGGTLNSTPSTATVSVYGGGSIVLPGVGNTLTTGSTLNFSSLGSAAQTVIDGAGTLLLNGTSDDGIFVRAGAEVELRLSNGAESKIDNAGKRLVLDDNTRWEYVGTGTRPLVARVVNNGGLFKLSGTAHVKVTGGGTIGGIFIPSYSNNDSPNALLHITNGCTLETNNGVRMNGGSLFQIMNPNLPLVAAQTATIKGNFEMAKGDIVFSGAMATPNGTVYGRLRIDGNVLWSGGIYRPVIELGSTKSNVWEVTGTMTVDASNATNKPRIEPSFPAGQQPVGTWLVLEAVGDDAQLQGGDDPVLPQGWNLQTLSTDGIKKKWSVNK